MWIGYKNGSFEKIELSYYDMSFKIKTGIFKKEPQEKGIVIVKIDNKTTSKFIVTGKQL